MPLVRVKNKYQVTLPVRLREQAGVSVGDLLEAKVEKGRIIFMPKSIVDRRIAESFEDFKRGRTLGPFSTAKEAMQALHAKARK
jgi:bifunctional DNA-binding transcriptional regulator/antitoxin component of YhaV-PrlF toxin-antitoxin module